MTTELEKAANLALTALKLVQPRTDKLICYASTASEHPPNLIEGKVSEAIVQLDAALSQSQRPAPVASAAEPAGYVAGPLVWNRFQTETVIKITRQAQPEHGFVHPVYAAQPAPASLPADPWPKLDKPATVGAGTFGVGVSSRLVVEAAQRQHEYKAEQVAKTKDEMQAEEANRRALWDMLHGSPASLPAAQPTRAEREAEQRARMAERFASRAATSATADFDLPPPNDAQPASLPAGEVDGIVSTSHAQDILEEWFQELGLDLDATDSKDLFDRLVLALRPSAAPAVSEGAAGGQEAAIGFISPKFNADGGVEFETLEQHGLVARSGWTPVYSRPQPTAAVPVVPEGWYIAITGGDEVVVRAPADGPGSTTIPSGQEGSLPVRLLSSLCRALLSAAPKPAGKEGV